MIDENRGMREREGGRERERGEGGREREREEGREREKGRGKGRERGRERGKEGGREGETTPSGVIITVGNSAELLVTDLLIRLCVCVCVRGDKEAEIRLVILFRAAEKQT